MAVFPEVPGIEVNICVDGQPLEEYLDDEDEIDGGATELEQYRASRTVSRFVESITGKEFSINLKADSPYVMDCEALGFLVSIDGQLVDRRILHKKKFEDLKGLGGVVIAVNALVVKRNLEQNISTARSFVFSAVGTTSEDNRSDYIKEDSEQIARVGDIKIDLHPMEKTSPVVDSESTLGRAFGEASVSEVHEKALKGSAKSHGTSLGSSFSEKVRLQYKSYPIDRLRPLAIYSFKYRSRDALKTLLIIPRTPEPEILFDEFTEEQKKQVGAFKRGLPVDGVSRVKRENSDDASSSFDKKPRLGNKGKEKVIVYDLTGDSDWNDSVR